MAVAHPRPQFLVEEWVFMVLKYMYTEIGNVLETIRRISKEQERLLLPTFLFKLKLTWTSYHNCPLLFVCTVSFDSKTVFET